MTERAVSDEPLDWHLVAILLTGAMCMGLRAAIESGQIPRLALFEFPYISSAVLVPYLCIPVVVQLALGRAPTVYFHVGHPRDAWRSIAGLLVFVCLSTLALSL